MKKIMTFPILIVLSLALVSAFGVSAPYWMNNPMVAFPGMDRDVNLNLQNIASPTGDVIAVMEVVEGNEIASLSRGEYEVKEGAISDVPLRIKIPSEAPIGSKYFVKVNIKTKAGGDGGTVALSTGMVVGFDVIVDERPAEEKEPTNLALYLIIAIAVVALIIISVVLSKKRKRH